MADFEIDILCQSRKILKFPHCAVPTALKKKEKNRKEQKKERRALEKIL